VSDFEPEDLGPKAHAPGPGTPGRMIHMERPDTQVPSCQVEPLLGTRTGIKGWLLVAGVALVFGLVYLVQVHLGAIDQAKADAATKASSDAATAIAADDAALHKWWAEAYD
jgi:hypothetical protein